MGVINDFIDQLASVVHNKRKDDEEEKRKLDAKRQVYSAKEFKKDEKSIPQKAAEFATNLARQSIRDVASGGSPVGSIIQTGLRESGRMAQRFPDTTVQIVKKNDEKKYGSSAMKIGNAEVPVSDAGAKILPLISSIPGEVVRSYGRTAERVATDEGRSKIVEGAKKLPSQLIDTARDPKKALSVLDNPLVEDAMNASDVLTLGAGTIATKGIKEGIERGAREGVEKTIRQAADETLRPFIKTSAGGMDLPSSVLASNLPSSSVTKTLTPSSIYSPTASVKDVLGSKSFIDKYQSTIKEKPFLDNLLSDLSQGRSFTTKIKDINTAAEKVIRKIKVKPEYSENNIGDLLRGNIIANDSTDATNMLQQLQQKVKAESVDDYINNPSQWGYQGINVNIKTPNGNLAEVQIHTPLSMEIQKQLHPLYEKYRNADTIPVEAYEESKRIVKETTDKFNKDQALQSVYGANAEQATALWEQKYMPEKMKLMKERDSLPPELRGQADQAINDLEKRFSDEVDALGKEKERKFITSVKTNENLGLSEDIKGNVEGNYQVRKNEELLKTVQKRIDDNPQAALEHVLSNNAADDEQVAMGIDLLRRANEAGDSSRAVDIVETLAPKLTEAGRTVQAASILGRLTPEGALVYTQRLINKANKTGKKIKKVTEQTAGEIMDLADKANKLPDGSREKTVAAAKLAKRINQEVPTGIGRKISTLQTIAQLMNPKTLIRNLGGNVGFSAIENVKDVVATPIDAAVGLITRERYKTFPNPVTQVKGFGRGFKEGAQDALAGIDTAADVGKFDLNKIPAFSTKAEDNIVKKVVYKPLEVLERITNLALKAPDRGSYQAAYDESMRQMMRVRKINDISKATDDMKAIAHADGLYRTFQDESIAAKMFGNIKQGLNVGKQFGAGDLVLKYPKTPGNILSRGIEYSPLGFFSSAINLVKMVLGKPNSQKAFVESTARATTGTAGMVATGALLHQMGIITGKPDKDSDIKALERKETMGDYRLNASALVRFVSSGFDRDAAKPQEGDNILTYDWFQPQAINFAMGADIDANNGVNPKSLAGTLFGAAASAANTLVEQPLVSGVQRLFNYGDLPGGVAETLAGLPSSFTPTLLNQVKQFMDNSSRDPQSPDLVEKGKNLVENKIPLINRNLPQRYDVFGDKVENFQSEGGGNNFFNVFLNPAFSSKIKTSPEGREVMRLFESTGESSQAPRQQGNSIQINGTTKELNGEEKQKYQQYIGVKTKEYFSKTISKEKYKSLSDEEKVKVLSNILTDVSVAAKIELFGHKPKQVQRKDRVKKIMNMEDPLPLISR